MKYMSTMLQKLQMKKFKMFAAMNLKNKLYQKYSDKSRYPVSLSMGPIAFQLVRCAVKIGIFDELDRKEGQTVEEMSAALNLELHPLNICLRALEYLKLLINIEQQYYNHPLYTMSFLKKHRDIFHSDTQLEYMHHIVGPACSFLEESLMTNKPHGLYNLFGTDCNFYEAISKDKAKFTYFDAFMKNITNRNKDRVTSDSFFSKHRKILDVGGSTGDIAISLAQHHPALEVTVLDFPEILKIALNKFSEHGLENRLDTYTGDPLKELPQGYDCMLFFHFFDIFSPRDIRVLLKNAYAALPSQGSIGIFTPVNYDNTVTHSDLFGPYFLCLAEGQGKFYTKEQIVEWIQKENFINVSIQELPFDDAFITAEKK